LLRGRAILIVAWKIRWYDPSTIMSIGMTNLDGALQVSVGTLLGRQLILISKEKMQVQTWFFGFQIACKDYGHDDIRDLRYEEWMENGSRTCGIRFKYQGGTHVLIKAAHETDTLRTVVRIINVYRFSHSLPVGEQQLSS
jgi:hypothetical protein